MKKGELLNIAISLAVEAHANQFDKGGNPYILHCLKVMHYVKSEDEEVLAIAVLHDSFEDNKNMTIEYFVERGITARVIEGVLALTKMPGESYITYKNKVKANKDAVLVKMADLRHNSDIRRLKGVTEKDVARIAKYMQFYSELRDGT
jgi:(p)ppGpp synthase/HD superfamily hydrolase